MVQRLLLVIEFFGLVHGRTGQVHAQLFKHTVIDLGQNDRRMHFGALERAELLDSQVSRRVGGRRDGQGNEHFVGVQAGVMVAQTAGFQPLDGFDDERRQQMQFIGQTSQMLEGVEQRRCRRTQQRRGAAGDDRAVGQFMAAAGLPVSSAFFSATAMTGRSAGVILAWFMSSSILCAQLSSARPMRASHRAW